MRKVVTAVSDWVHARRAEVVIAVTFLTATFPKVQTGLKA